MMIQKIKVMISAGKIPHLAKNVADRQNPNFAGSGDGEPWKSGGGSGDRGWSWNGGEDGVISAAGADFLVPAERRAEVEREDGERESTVYESGRQRK